MDFLCFTANCGQKYAVKIDELIAIVDKPAITAVPGTKPHVVGMVMWRHFLVPVVDIAMLYSGIEGNSRYMVILDGTQKFGVLVDEISDVTRGEIPDGVRFMDVHDFEVSVATYDASASHIELF